MSKLQDSIEGLNKLMITDIMGAFLCCLRHAESNNVHLRELLIERREYEDQAKDTGTQSTRTEQDESWRWEHSNGIPIVSPSAQKTLNTLLDHVQLAHQLLSTTRSYEVSRPLSRKRGRSRREVF